MDRVTTFCRLRSALAPAIRPVLQYVPPVRWVALKLLACRQPTEVEVGGLAFDVHPADFGVTFEIASTGDYEPVTRASCIAALHPGMTFIDIGAHVGLFAVPAAMAVGRDGRVIAFEPDPDNRRLLTRNVARHGLENVTIVDAAVADRQGEITLKRSPFNTGDHRIDARAGGGGGVGVSGGSGDSGGSGGRGVQVPMVSLDDWMSEHEVEPDVIKMDVQGAEPLVLRGMQSVLESDRPLHLLLEFAPSMLRAAGADPRAVLLRLELAGFAMKMIDERRGEVVAASVDAIMLACPNRSYVNVHCVRGAS